MKKNIFEMFILVGILVVSFSGGVLGATINAGSCEYVDVASAVASASAGDIVLVPAGNCVWNDILWGTITTNLSIKGAGMDQTIITDNRSAGKIMQLEIDTGVRFELSDFKFVQGPFSNGCLEIHGKSTEKIIHDIIIDQTAQTGGRGFTFGNPNNNPAGAGVMYNVNFYGATVGQGISIFGSYSEGWDGTPTWGEISNAYYIENCTFDFTSSADGALDAYKGARLVFRHNNLINTHIGWHGYDSEIISLHTAEIYNNTFTSSVAPQFSINIRGGTAVIYDNTYTDNYASTFTLSSYRSCWDIYSSGRCNGTAVNDGNTPGMQGYPCYMQPGTSGSDYLTNWPIIEWNNNYNGGSNNMGFWWNANFVPPVCDNPSSLDHVKEERDYLNHITCSDSIDNDGDGLTDMDDLNCINFWDSINGKASNYIPAVYPHPLTLLDEPTCTEAGGTCQTNTCGTYIDCTDLVGECTTGSCCSGTCTSTNPVLHLTFEEGSGTTATDSSGNNNDGIINGAIYTTGKIGSYALEFDGSDYINISDSLSMDFDKSQGSIEMWVKPVNPASGVYQLLAIDNNYAIEFNMQGDGDLFYYPSVNDSWSNYNLVTNPLVSGAWNHIVTTWNYPTKEVKIYVNGIEQVFAVENVPTYWSTLALTSDWHIGGSPVKNQYFNGAIDEVRIYNKALTSVEVLEHYGGSTCSPADTDSDGVVSITEVMAYITEWKAGSVDIVSLMTGITEWKSGCT